MLGVVVYVVFDLVVGVVGWGLGLWGWVGLYICVVVVVGSVVINSSGYGVCYLVYFFVIMGYGCV